MQDLTQEEFSLITDYIYRTCGIVIKDDKKYLILQRLGPLAQEAGCKTFGDYFRIMKAAENDEHMRIKLIETITTN